MYATTSLSNARRPVVNDAGVQLAILLAVGLLLRISTFGDPNLQIDESFYLLVGEEMHKGAIPYVDIWDRKPLGIFLTYWVFAFFRNGVLAYQIGAWLSASLTAFLVTRIASRWAPAPAALLAGCIYLATAGVLLGFGGQTPIFYNTFVACAALLVFRYGSEREDWQLYTAMLLLGVALTFKQTVFFEASFFGLLALGDHRSWRKALLSITLGILPFALIAGWYWLAGYWPQFFEAMVLANLDRPAHLSSIVRQNALMLAAELGPLLIANLYAFLFYRDTFPARSLALWLFAAVLGFFSVPFVVEHYALPALVPLCIVAAAAFAARPLGPLLALGVGLTAIMLSEPVNFDRHRRSAAGFAQMVSAIGPLHRGERLLVYDGPPLLYYAVGTRPMSVLAFPEHLNNVFEKDVSTIRTVPELRRVISMRPAAVVMAPIPITPPDPATYRQLLSYVRSQCAPPVAIDLVEPFGKPSPHIVYAKCGRAR